MTDLRPREGRSTEVLLETRNLTKSFPLGDRTVPVLQGIDLEVHAAEGVAVVGPSGAGKSTLLHILGALDRPTGGTVLFHGRDLSTLGEDELGAFRNRSVGFVFQFHHLLPEFTALENVLMPALIRRRDRREAEGAARALLGEVGLGQRLDHRPGELSGGEQQRVAVARALLLEPEVLLADEPTGNLDRGTGKEVEDLFLGFVRRRGVALVLVTHNEDLGARMDRTVSLRDGRVVSGGRRP